MFNSKLRKPLRAFPRACLALAFMAPMGVRAELERHPDVIGAAIDMGQVVKGSYQNGESADEEVLTRTGVYITYGANYNKKLEIALTIGGLFWYPFTDDKKQPYTRLLQFGPGVGQAQGIYSFGNPDDPAAKLQFGLFPMKYNSDANNLGEYLFRSGTYPGYLWTGGWSYINSASYMAEGAHLTVPTLGGKVLHEVTLFLERDIDPTGDISPGYMVTVKPNSIFEFGAGAVWSHGIALRSDKYLTPKNITDKLNQISAYDKRTGMPLTQYDDVDTSTACLTGGTCKGIPSNQLGFYTFKGIKTMARASWDIGTMLSTDLFSPGDFKLYTEWALLGVANQPFYYAHRSERMPIMAGVNIPTFKILDKLSLEVEYHKSRFENNVGVTYDRELPVPLGIGQSPLDFTDSALALRDTKQDDWHWSVNAKRKIINGMVAYVQVASDHQRQIDGEAKPSPTPTTLKTKDWYYIFRLEFGLF